MFNKKKMRCNRPNSNCRIYMNTIKSQQDTIQFQQNTIKNFQDANEIYYDRIVEWWI